MASKPAGCFDHDCPWTHPPALSILSDFINFFNRPIPQEESDTVIVSVTVESFQKLKPAGATRFVIKVGEQVHPLSSAPGNSLTNVFPVRFAVPQGEPFVDVEVQAWAGGVRYDISPFPGSEPENLSLFTTHRLGTTQVLSGDGTEDGFLGGPQAAVRVFIESVESIDGIRELVTISTSIDSLEGIPRVSIARATEEMWFRITNTGNVNWTFGTMISTRRTDGKVVNLPLASVTVSPNQTQIVSFPITWGEPGIRDIRITVWQEAYEPFRTLLADSGWLTEYLTVVPETTPTPPIPNSQPVVSRVTPSSGSLSLSVGDSFSFTAQGDDVDGNLSGVEWWTNGRFISGESFNATSSRQVSMSRPFQEAKIFTVEAIFSDTEGATGSVSWTVTVT